MTHQGLIAGWLNRKPAGTAPGPRGKLGQAMIVTKGAGTEVGKERSGTLRVVLYSHDSQGLGHTRRNLALAHALSTLAFARRQARMLQNTGYDVAALAEAGMFSGKHAGNIVLAATAQWDAEWTAALVAAGPHPAAVLTGSSYDDFARRGG